MAKQFKLSAAEIRPLAEGMGSCIASDRITVDGRSVGFMYREAPDGAIDSGWRFFSGDESQEYADNPDNFAMYSVNTIANYDPSIVPYLTSATGCAFGRNDQGQFELEAMPSDPDA